MANRLLVGIWYRLGASIIFALRYMHESLSTLFLCSIVFVLYCIVVYFFRFSFFLSLVMNKAAHLY